MLDVLGEEPDRPKIRLTFERVLLEDDQDMIGITADAAGIWGWAGERAQPLFAFCFLFIR